MSRGTRRVGSRGRAACWFVFAVAWAPPTAAADPGEVASWIDALSSSDPLAAEAATAKLHLEGSDALPALASRLTDGSDRTGDRRVLLDLFSHNAAEFLERLENEYRSLDLDRREIEAINARREARREYAELRPRIDAWTREDPEAEADAMTFAEYESLRSAKDRGDASELDAKRLDELAPRARELIDETPDIAERAASFLRLRELEFRGGTPTDLADVETLRLEDLEQRVRDRQPRVDELLATARGFGDPFYATIHARRPMLPLRGAPAGELRSPVAALYDRLLDEARLASAAGSWSPSDEVFERTRYVRSWLWLVEAEQDGQYAAEARGLLERHVPGVLADLDSSDTSVRSVAEDELYRLGERGVAALRDVGAANGGPRGFLHELLRWRVAPSVYERFGFHFRDYANLPLAERRRRIFEFARVASRGAIPTLRAIVLDDSLEASFLVKYAAAKALAVQLDDRLGYIVLQSLRPDVVMKSPGLARELQIIQGIAHRDAKEYTAAIESFREILDALPFDFEANYHIAFVYLLMKQYEKAIHHFEIARRIEPKDQLTLYNLACAYSLSGHQDEALDALEESIDAGFRDVEHMKRDGDLDPIRASDRFHRLLDKAAASDE